MKYKMNQADETIAFANKLGLLLQAGDLLTLEGDLGAGKTTFTKGIGQGLGVTSIINSPTFTILKIYEGRLPLYHMDAYRLEDQSSFELGFEEFFNGDGVCVVEWPNMIEEDLPKDRLHIKIETVDDGRMIELIPNGKRYIEICEEMK